MPSQSPGQFSGVTVIAACTSANDNPLVRVHLQDTLGDVVGVKSRSLGWPLHSAIERIAEEEAGVVVLLRDMVDDTLA